MSEESKSARPQLPQGRRHRRGPLAVDRRNRSLLALTGRQRLHDKLARLEDEQAIRSTAQQLVATGISAARYAGAATRYADDGATVRWQGLPPLQRIQSEGEGIRLRPRRQSRQRNLCRERSTSRRPIAPDHTSRPDAACAGRRHDPHQRERRRSRPTISVPARGGWSDRQAGFRAHA